MRSLCGLLGLLLLCGVSHLALCSGPATFLYFGYGSNLLARRIHVNNPTAVRKTIGKLQDYRLDFNWWSRSWNGSVATIVPDPGKQVWGAVWEIDSSQLDNLDKQEGVHLLLYFPLSVIVETLDDEHLQCRTYQLYDNPGALGEGETLPEGRRPSQSYLSVIIEGAQESGLPEDYFQRLQQIPHNGLTSTIPTEITGITEAPNSENDDH